MILNLEQNKLKKKLNFKFKIINESNCNGHGPTQDYRISVREAFIKMKSVFVANILYFNFKLSIERWETTRSRVGF